MYYEWENCLDSQRDYWYSLGHDKQKVVEAPTIAFLMLSASSLHWIKQFGHSWHLPLNGDKFCHTVLCCFMALGRGICPLGLLLLSFTLPASAYEKQMWCAKSTNFTRPKGLVHPLVVRSRTLLACDIYIFVTLSSAVLETTSQKLPK